MKIEDLVNQKPEVLLRKFGKYGLTIWNLAKGIDERKVEEAIERMYRSEQQDMFDDPDMNWSGLR